MGPLSTFLACLSTCIATVLALPSGQPQSPFLQIHSIDGNHCYELSVTKDSPCFDSFWEVHAKENHQYEGWPAGPCPSKFSFANKKDASICADGSVVSKYLGLGGEVEVVPVPLGAGVTSLFKSKHSTDGNHCYQLAVTNDNGCFEAFWGNHAPQYNNFSDGLCPSMFNDVLNKTEVCADGSVVTEYIGIGSDNLYKDIHSVNGNMYKDIHNIEIDGNHCYGLSVTKDSPCFDSFWEVHEKENHQYEGWSAGPCPSRFSFVNKKDASQCADGSVVLMYLGL